ncbi:hypothetical protein ACHQM5_006853 [Ranunculus cassubicifolius]
MGSKGRVPPPLSRRPPPDPRMMHHPDPFGQHPDPFGHRIRPPPGAFPPFDMLPPPDILEQKLAVQNEEIHRLATENQRLAATHVTLRQDVAAGQQEIQIVQSQIGAVKHEKEHQIRGLRETIAKMENDLQSADSIKLELQEAQAEAQTLVAARQELIEKVQRLSQDYQRTYADVQQIPMLLSEMDVLKREYESCRATYDYEKKLYNDHNESLQAMEKNYLSMSREVEKLRAELASAVGPDLRTVAAYGDHSAAAPYGASTGYKANEAAGHYGYEDGYNVYQAHAAPPTAYAGGPTSYDAAPPRRTGYEAQQPRTSTGPQGQVTAPYGQAGAQQNFGVGGSYDARVGGGNPATPPALGGGGGYDGQVRGGNPSAPPSNVGGGGYEAQQHRGGNPARR